MPTSLHADVLIIGSGPSGAAAAISLARAGVRVVVADRATFPRDKVCGDALIPDALAALDRLALRAPIIARARRLSGVRIYAPNQRTITVAGECACLPRQLFDDHLRQAAVDAGADLREGLTLERPLRGDDGALAGATFSTPAGAVSVRAPLTLLATGAAAEPLKRFGVCERIAASATAARLYLRADEPFARDQDHLLISYDRAICPGYGWIFPGPGGLFNVGIGYFYDARRPPPDRNVRTLLARFLAEFPPARELLRHARPVTSLKGAPLRTRLTGARLSAPGLLVIGEAAGTTYSFSGEGIGKAMESGLTAAQAIVAAGDRRAAPWRYEQALRSRFARRFAAYGRVQDWLTNPAVANLLAWRAERSRFVSAQLEGIFQERSEPEALFSLAGMVRTIVG